MSRGWRCLSSYVLTIFLFFSIVNLGNKSINVLSEQKAFDNKACIVIDPGHGGIDGGATSCTGILESTYNLDIAICLNDLFHLLGYHTKLTRESDISIYTEGETIAQKKLSDLKARVRLANETEGALLLSIHQNHYPDPRYFGAQVFYANTDRSETFAKLLQARIVRDLNNENRRQAKRCTGVYLMEHINCTGVLVECGFISNPEEATMLQDKRYQQQLCGVIASAAADYLSNT